MLPTFELDLRRSAKPVRCAGDGGFHSRVAAPEGERSARKGLRLPLKGGALAFESRDKIDDAAGALEIEFVLDEVDQPQPLLQAFGQYKPLVEIARDELRLNVYHHHLRMLVSWVPARLYRLRVSWDHTAGVALEVRRARGPVQRLVRRMTWRAFRQKYVPFSIGGMLDGRPVFTMWTGSFKGWVRRVRTWRAPLEVPAPVVRVSARGHSPLSAHHDVRVLALHDPPVRDSRWRCDTIPPRLEDLRKTRRIARLDEVVARCSDEMQVFRRLTWHVSRMWPHFYYWPWPRDEQRHIFWKRGHEMIPLIERGEMGGMCGGFAHVMEELFWAMGFDARRTQVYGHSTFEAYSNQFNKWIVCDASFNRDAHLFVDAKGEPLGVRDFVLRHERLCEWPHAFDDVRAAICQEDGSARIVETTWWSNYSHVGIGLGDPSRNQGNRPHIWYFLEHERPAFEGSVNVGGESTLVEDLDEIFWSCQRAQVSLEWADPGRRLRVTTKPFQVTFPDGFERKVDEGGWERCGARFTWTLHPGVNALAVRTRNKLGAAGHPWRIQLWRRP